MMNDSKITCFICGNVMVLIEPYVYECTNRVGHRSFELLPRKQLLNPTWAGKTLAGGGVRPDTEEGGGVL